MKITANSPTGRVLLALRAGRMERSQLVERFPTTAKAIYQLVEANLAELNEDCYQITPAGRAACPNRRDATFEPLHTGPTSKTRAHGWSSTRQQNGAIA